MNEKARPLAGDRAAHHQPNHYERQKQMHNHDTAYDTVIVWANLIAFAMIIGLTLWAVA